MLKYLIVGLALVFLFSRLLPRLGAMLGHRSRKPFRQAKWMWTWVSGSEEDAIRAEQEYGRECAREFAAQFSDPPAPAMRAAVDEVGARLAGAVSQPGREFEFRAVGSAVANAYALPGGFVFITEPLLDLCRDDRDALAFILAHEMAHVLRGHAREQLTAGVFLNAVTSRLAGAGRLLREMLGKGYSRDLEFEADREGVRLAAAAGFDPAGARRALGRLASVSPDFPGWAEYLSSHPPIADRIREVG